MIFGHKTGLEEFDHQWPYFFTLFLEVVMGILYKVGLRIESSLRLGENIFFNKGIKIVIVGLSLFEDLLIFLLIGL